MSKKSASEISPYENVNVPMYFADQPAALMLGAAVSRITFGVAENDGSDFPRPVVTIAIPTLALMQLVHDLKKSFDSPSFRKGSVQSLADAAKTMAAGGKSTPTADTFVVENSKLTKKATIAHKQ